MTMLHVRSLLVTCLVGLPVAVAQVPSEAEPLPLEKVNASLEFEQVHGRPKWFRSPVPRQDRLSFTTSRVDRDVERTCVRVSAHAKQDVRDLLFEHVMPTLGQKDAMIVLEHLVGSALLVSAEVGTITLHKGTDREQQKPLACLGWRVPIRSVVEKFEPRDQGRIEWVLIRPMVYWHVVQRAPQWASKPPSRQSYVRCAFAHTAKNIRLASGAAIGAASRDVHSYLVELLTPAVGKGPAAVAADAGVKRLGAVSRATLGVRRMEDGRDTKATAFCLWEVPVAPMLLALPKKLRAVAKMRLQ